MVIRWFDGGIGGNDSPFSSFFSSCELPHVDHAASPMVKNAPTAPNDDPNSHVDHLASPTVKIIITLAFLAVYILKDC